MRGHVYSVNKEAHVVLIHADVHVDGPYFVVEPDFVAPDSFLGGPKDISLLPIYALNDARNKWEGEVT